MNLNMPPPAIVKAVEESVTVFFTGSCGLAIAPEAPAGDQPPGIMSTISFRGDEHWYFALAFCEDEAVTIARAFAGFDIPFDSPDMGDVVGEMVNVIAGDISARLGKVGIAAQMSLPTTVRGDPIPVPPGAPTARLTFSGPAGACWLNLVGPHTVAGSDTTDSGPAHSEAAELLPAPRSQESAPTACEEAVAVPFTSRAWAAEAEPEFVEQNVAGLLPQETDELPLTGSPAAPANRSIGPIRALGRWLLYLALAFACGGSGVLAGVLLMRAGPMPDEPTLPASHANKPSTGPKSPVPRIDALVRSGRFAEGLRECLGAPRNGPGASETALALREGLCLEGTGLWWEASNAYQKAEDDPNVAVAVAALLGRARCAAQQGSYTLARALTRRVVFRSGHPGCHGLEVREEAQYLRSKIDALESGAAPLHAGVLAQPLPSTSACNCLDWLERAPAEPVPGPSRDVLEVHRAFTGSEVLRVTVRLTPRPAIAVLRALGSAAGWKVQASDSVLALLKAPVGPLEVDHVPVSELLGVLTEGTGVAWVIQSDGLFLTQRERGDVLP
ncbi:: CheX [Gemmata massiliana]|uniref:: CheX n=1 Tax=Gemmata massiliana TaxID=1210884 RepID=A0A6P2D6A5_9BACT|nr:chemotaxis protein CheX [Gemmata massiliana]VTR96679.1 : CheX [Gemmata massiliana]